MAWTSWGFDGTINEAQWSQMAGLLGNDYVAAGNGDCLVTAVPGARSVSVAAGTLYGDGVVSVNSGAETVAMTTPVNGQWYVIALRRTWATNTAALVAIAGATTTTTTPTAPPSSFPTLNTQPGVLTDQPIAWAWCNSANTTVVVYDIRLKAVKSLPPVVANATERDAKFMSPTQGLQVWRDDLGATQTYYALYNSSTNPGGRDTAGWYTEDRQTGLIPIKPTSITAVSGSATANAIGQVSASNVTGIILDGVFSANYASYRVVITDISQSVNGTELYLRMRNAGSTYTSSTHSFHGVFQQGSNNSAPWYGDAAPFINLGRYASNGSVVMDIYRPNMAARTALSSTSWGYYVSETFHAINAAIDTTTQFDGLHLYVPAGVANVLVQVFGYND